MRIVLLLVVASTAVAQNTNVGDPSNCPLHAQHMQQEDARFAGVQKRGADPAGMGFSQTATTHRFLTTKTGGIIQVTANDAKDEKTVAAIRRHMRKIAQDFSAGDFSTPHFVHDEDVPGTREMKQLASAITYKAEEISTGARVVITTRSAAALHAVHAFLSFQVEEHHTHDRSH
jgi:hypothetical protein